MRAVKMPERSASTAKKVAFSLLATLAFFLVLELALAAVGVRPILFDEDPYVGFSSYIPLFVEQTDNDGKVRLTTAQNKLDWFNEQSFPKQKPKNSYRVFCLGGSTTYGRPYDDTTSFCGWLRELLTEADPSRQWEVINAGGISYASYRVAKLMEELIHYQPDLFIIYSGHNEFLESRTYESISRLPSSLHGIGTGLSRTRTFTAMKHLVHGNRANRKEKAGRAELPGEVKALMDDGVGPDAYHRDMSWQQQVLDHYRINLLRMVDIARSARARVVLVTPAANLRDSSPFKSQHRDGFDEVQRKHWQTLFDEALKLRAEAALESSLSRLDAAAEIDDRHAQMHYVRGHVLFELGRHADAKAAFVRARDEDVCPLRALTPMRTIVNDVASQRDVPVVDFVQLVEDRSKHGIPGQQWFLDHVHPTIAGNRMLAMTLLEELVAQSVVTPSPTWGEQSVQRVVQRVEGRLDRRAHGIALRNLSKVLSWAGKKDEANRLALRAAEMVSDANTRYLAGNALAQEGKIEEAVTEYLKALENNPDYLQARNALGAAYHRLGKLEQAVAEYQHALRIDPDFAPTHNNLGTLYQRLGKHDQAQLEFDEAIRLSPGYSKAYNNLGVLLRAQRKLDLAAAQFRKAKQINPELPEAHFNLGTVHALKGQAEMAIEHFRNALRVNPDYGPAHHHMAIELLKKRDYREAVSHLRKALQQKPPPLSAASVLAWTLATCQDDEVRNGKEAVQWAQHCVRATGRREAGTINTLAAAYAELGDFQQAIRWQNMALRLAPDRLKPQCRDRLQLYQSGRPYREAFGKSRS